MNNEKDKKLDDLFRRGLKDPVENTGYMEDDWAAMEGMLDGGKKRRGIVYWLPILSGVAALCLLFLGWWAFRPKANNAGNNQTQAVIKQPKVAPATNNVTAVQPPKANSKDVLQPTVTPQNAAQQPAVQQPKAVNAASYASNSKINKGKNLNNSTQFVPAKIYGGNGVPDLVKEQGFAGGSGADLVAYSAMPMQEQSSITAAQISMPAQFIVPVNTSKGLSDHKIKIKKQGAFIPQYAISVLAAPDINGVGSFQQSKVGTNIGLLFSAGVTRKLTVSTGALYSVKPYITPFADYHTHYQFAENPVNVTADCRMLDIPVNVGYQLFNKHQNKLSVGTGLSSYIMLHESYKFNYAEYGTTGPANYTVPNSSKYFFGVLNLNATYQRQLNDKVGLSIQPYLKLPLTDIGYSQVRLQTTGVAVGLTWNLNSSLKP